MIFQHCESLRNKDAEHLESFSNKSKGKSAPFLFVARIALLISQTVTLLRSSRNSLPRRQNGLIATGISSPRNFSIPNDEIIASFSLKMHDAKLGQNSYLLGSVFSLRHYFEK